MVKKVCLFLGVVFGGVASGVASDFPAGLGVSEDGIHAQDTEQGGLASKSIPLLKGIELEPNRPAQLRQATCDPCCLCHCVGVAIKLCQEEYWRIGLDMLQVYAGRLVSQNK